LQTINNELRERSNELDEVNEFLESIMNSWHTGVAVVDRSMRVVVWNSGAEELWGLRQEETDGEHLLNLDIGLPVSELRPIVRAALTDPAYSDELQLAAVNRRGRHIVVRVVCSAMRNRSGQSAGAILIMELIEQSAEAEPEPPPAS
jgi:two-component system CheB/CheR fusion protein